MTNYDRPLSPHLSIYRWPVTMATSILHRGTGLAMSLGFVLFVFWLADMAVGRNAYAAFMTAMDSTVGRILLIGWSWAFFYHLANGIRHLVWDVGYGFEKRQANASAWVVIVWSALATAFFWMMAS